MASLADMEEVLRTTPDRYTRTAVLLHWLLAVLIVVMVVLGFYMTEIPRNTPERAFYFNLHKSLGLLVFMLVLVRIVWRITHPVPELPSSIPLWQRRASAISHGLLYVCMVLQPATGYIASSFSKYGIRFFGIPLPNWGWEDPGLRSIFVAAHETIVLVFITLIAIHVLAALKHALVDRNEVMQRMWL